MKQATSESGVVEFQQYRLRQGVGPHAVFRFSKLQITTPAMSSIYRVYLQAIVRAVVFGE